MTKSEYRDYIASEYWQARRRAFLVEHKGCFDCYMSRHLSVILYDQDLHVDHLNYQRIGREVDDDLQVLCRRCHEIKHLGTSMLAAPPKCDVCGGGNWSLDPWGTCLPCAVATEEAMRVATRA